nr:expressed protein [Hymenolepis microstoma]
MSGNVGIPITLFIFVGLLAFSISYEGWSCGRLCDKKCLNIEPKMPIILGLISGGGVLALIGAILYSVYISNESDGLRIAAAVLTVLAAGCAIAAIFYFYIDMPNNSSKIWGQLMAMFASGLGLGVVLCLLGTFCENLL